ncbi:DUF898 family protein [Phenylobacterium sp.]|jgi:uncharacterized membrane protein YjgN (DUF898 family)|uniref:DUF898 family protein n=1 Tax=Phenylobacterium sp. TaxID=1871053 RepID=UPI0035B2D413
MSRTDVAPGGTSLSPEQHLDTEAFRALSLRGALLAVPTLTLHRFWGRSETRRWLWDATDLGGDPLDYGGSGGELLAGFLIKWLVIGGCLLGAWTSLQAMGAWGAPLIVLLVAGAVYAHGFTRFAGFVYLASRTAWRGEMFEVEGSPVAFAARELRDAALMVVTAGWWAPRAQRARTAALWGGLRHPGARLGFDAGAAGREPLYSAFAIGWFASVMILLFIAGVMLGLASGFFPTPDVGAAPSVGQLAALALLLAGLWVLLRAAWAPYCEATRAATAAGFHLRLRRDEKAAARAALTDGAILAGSLGLLAPWVAARKSARLFAALSNRGEPARLSVDAERASLRTRGETHAIHAADL